MKKTFKILLFTTLALGCCGSIDAKKKQKFDVNPDLPMSIRMAQSEIIRNPEGWMLDFSQKLKWNYCHGLECQSFLDVYDHYKGEKKYAKAVAPFYTYVKDYADTIINENGIIYGYKKTNYNLDHVNSGKILFRLYDREKDPRYKIAMDTLRAQLASQPRTSEGGFWHKKVYPFQMWLDGLYMGEPYYAEYTATFDADNTQAYADIVNQFLLVAKRTYDKETGLYRHAWDEIKALPWSDKSGRAPHVWGRALGWYMMAIVDVLDYLPESQPGRDKMITIKIPKPELGVRSSTKPAVKETISKCLVHRCTLTLSPKACVKDTSTRQPSKWQRKPIKAFSTTSSKSMKKVSYR